MIFVETKRKADDLTRGMRKDGWPALCIHGDKNQTERDWVLKGQFFFVFLKNCLKLIIICFNILMSSVLVCFINLRT